MFVFKWKGLPIFILIGICMFTMNSSHAQKLIPRELRSTPVENNRGPNVKIRTAPPLSDEHLEKSQVFCKVDITNMTGFYVNVYIDGNYRGQLSPWGKATMTYDTPYSWMYCITVGGTREWDDTFGSCCSSTYQFILYP